MPPNNSKLGSAKALHSQAREIIFNVYKFMKDEMLRGAPQNLKQVQKRVSQATGVSERSLRNVLHDAKSIERGEKASFITPGKKRVRKIKKVNLDDFDKCVVRRTIHNFHKTNKERPTLKKIHSKLVSDINFKGGLTTLRQIIKELGFKWKKTEDSRKILIETHNIRLLRMKYLIKVREFRDEGRPIIYTDETYLHSSHTTSNSWADNSSDGLKAPISKGRRLIVVHAGSNEGFIPNASLVFESNKKTGDYHHEMNFENYAKWLIDKLIPNLPPNSVVVVDNASYHNKQHNKAPTSSDRKLVIQNWLTERNIPFTLDMLKPQLYELVLQNKHRFISYKIDRILANYGHTTLRLPPYHPDLNPIEKIWALVKNHVAQKNVTFKLEDAKALLDEKLLSVTKEEWSKRCKHAIDIEKKYIESDHIMDDVSERIVINVGDDSDSDQESFDSEQGSDMEGIEPLAFDQL